LLTYPISLSYFLMESTLRADFCSSVRSEYETQAPISTESLCIATENEADEVRMDQILFEKVQSVLEKYVSTVVKNSFQCDLLESVKNFLLVKSGDHESLKSEVFKLRNLEAELATRLLQTRNRKLSELLARVVNPYVVEQTRAVEGGIKPALGDTKVRSKLSMNSGPTERHRLTQKDVGESLSKAVMELHAEIARIKLRKVDVARHENELDVIRTQLNRNGGSF